MGEAEEEKALHEELVDPSAGRSFTVWIEVDVDELLPSVEVMAGLGFFCVFFLQCVWRNRHEAVVAREEKEKKKEEALPSWGGVEALPHPRLLGGRNCKLGIFEFLFFGSVTRMQKSSLGISTLVVLVHLPSENAT